MAATVEPDVGRLPDGEKLVRVSEQSAANTALTLSARGPARVVLVTAQYSNTPVQAGVTSELDSGLGANFDVTLNTGSANARTTIYNPGGDVPIAEGDAVRITAPAGGANIVCAIAVYLTKAGPQ